MEQSLLRFIYSCVIDLINLPLKHSIYLQRSFSSFKVLSPIHTNVVFTIDKEQGVICFPFPRFCFIEPTVKCHKCCKYNNISVICFTLSEFTVWMTFKVNSDDIQGNNSTRSEEQPQQKLTGGSGYHVPCTNKPAELRLLEEPQTSYYAIAERMDGWTELLTGAAWFMSLLYCSLFAKTT